MAGAVGANATDALVDHVRDGSRSRFLPPPMNYNWQTQYLLPDDAGTLSVTARPTLDKGDHGPQIRLDLSVRGITNDTSDEGIDSWFELAHDWIVQGFVDVTADAMQEQVWRRLE